MYTFTLIYTHSMSTYKIKVYMPMPNLCSKIYYLEQYPLGHLFLRPYPIPKWDISLDSQNDFKCSLTSY